MEKIDVTLINYAISTFNGSNGPVPSGLMLEGNGPYLMGCLKNEDYTSNFFDFNNTKTPSLITSLGKEGYINYCIERLDESIKKNNTQLVGFTLYSNGAKDVFKIVNKLKKKNPNVTFVAGGPLVGYISKEIFELSSFDCLVKGEGYESITKLADVIYKNESISQVPGAIYKSNGEIKQNKKSSFDLNQLPIPSYENYLDIQFKAPIATLTHSVGCWHGKCIFCYHPRAHGIARERSIEETLKEMQMLKKLGITNYRLSDPNPRGDRIGELLKAMDTDMKLSAFAYSGNYDLSKVKKKLSSLFIGLESTRPDVLIKLGKTNDPDTYLNNCKELLLKAKEADVSTILTSIFPIPFDTPKDAKKIVYDYIKLNPDFVAPVALTPIPCTPLEKKILIEGEKSGFILEDNFTQKMAFFELDLLNGTEMAKQPSTYKMNFNNQWVDKPWAITNQHITIPLTNAGIPNQSDEIVIMAEAFYGNLNNNQTQRRLQVDTFKTNISNAINNGDSKTLQKIVNTMWNR